MTDTIVYRIHKMSDFVNQTPICVICKKRLVHSDIASVIILSEEKVISLCPDCLVKMLTEINEMRD